MGLSITVQKGHDFSSGNVTRAALNAGATPTIAITGSVGDSELADDSVDDANIKDTAQILAKKLNIPNDTLLVGGTVDDIDNRGKSYPIDTSLQSATLDGSIKLLADTGYKIESVATNLSDRGGHVGIQKDFVSGSGVTFLKLLLNTGVVTGGHLHQDLFTDSVTRNSVTGQIEVGANSVDVTKLKREGTSGHVLTSNGANLDPEYKELEIAASPVFETESTSTCYYLVPTTTTKIRIQAVGGGGGGSGDLSSTEYGGGGGGAGAYVQADFSVLNNGAVKTLNSSVTDDGADYSAALGLSTTGGTGTGATITVQTVDGNGAITGFALTTGGSGYTAGDVLTVVQEGASGGEVTVTETEVALLKISAGAGGTKGTNAVGGTGGASFVHIDITGTTNHPNSQDAPDGTIIISAAAGAGGAYSQGSVAAGGTGGQVANCTTGAGAYNTNVYAGGNGGDNDTQWYGAEPVTGTYIGNTAGHGGHSRWGAPATGLNTTGSTAESVGQGYGQGGRGHNDHLSNTESSQEGGRGHIKVFLLN